MCSNIRWSGSLIVLGLCLSCVTSRIDQPEDGASRGFRSLTPTATARELTEVGRDHTLFQALRRYRPLFLKSRGTTPMVTMDGGPLLDLSFLETVRVSAIVEVTLLRAPSAYSGDREVLFVRTTSVLTYTR